MKKIDRKINIVVALVLVFFVLATFASAQTIKPRRPGPAVTAPAATPTPSVAPSAAPAISPSPSVSPSPAPVEESEAEPTPTPEPTPTVVELNLEQKVSTNYTLGGALRAGIQANVNTTGLGYTNDEVLLLRKRVERANQKLNWILRGAALLGAINILVLIITMTGMKKMKGVVPIVLLALGVFSTQAQAATTPTCTIRAISEGGVVVKEQEAAPIVFSVRNCGEVKGVVVDDNTTIVVKGWTATRVTAEVASGTDAVTGPTGFKLVLTDGSEIESPESIYLLILDPATAQVRKDLKQEISTTSKEVAAVRSEVKETMSSLQNKIDAVALAAMTTEKVNALLEERLRPIREKLALLEKSGAALNGQIGNLNDGLSGVMEDTQDLAGVVSIVTNKKTGGFLGIGKKPMNEEASKVAGQIAERIRLARERVARAREAAKARK